MSHPTQELVRWLTKTPQDLRRVARLLREIETTEKGPLDDVQRIEKMVSELQKLIAGLAKWGDVITELNQWVEDYRARLEDRKRELKRGFGARLEALLKEQGFELKGLYPELKAGFYTIEVNFDRWQATIWYGPKQELMDRCKLSASMVAKHLELVHKDLTGRPIDEEAFLKKLHDAYLRALSRLGRKEGEQAPILQVLSEYVFLNQDKRFYTDPRKEHFKGYGRAHFSYDLFRLKQRRLLGWELSLVVATRANTISRERFLWVPTDEKGDGTAFAYLQFREVR
ncbi:MAG TPA: hypothetical protein VNL95_00145 [Dehalococcoidia bacterium]|nr:hypothetical protein [Dehalococcoidia bacterium]